ncbi:MAG: class I SAM-dependent methyltransferase [Tepidisphaeraceae bacterium]
MAEAYSKHFEGDDRAAGYESGEYAPGSYAELLWRIEQDQLRAVLAELRIVKPRIDAMDFASGTGRITAMLEDQVDAVTGIEISESMCELARRKLTRGKILCRNILAPDAQVEGKYDLITAFRFFLNAEPELRAPALIALRNRLRERDSALVFNNHGNPWSHKLLLWPYHRIRRLGRKRVTTGNYLSHGQIMALLQSAGLRLVRVTGCGFYSPKVAKIVGDKRAERWERRAAQPGWRNRWCVNQMYVTKLA